MNNNNNLEPNLMSITDNIEDISVSPDLDSVETSAGTKNIVIIIALSIILGILGINVLLYVFEQTDIISKFMSEGLVGIIRSMQKIFSGGLKSTSDILNKTANSNYYEEDKELNKAINKPSLVTKNNIKPDNTTESSIQNPKNTQWCYIGKDRTYRSCVKINQGDTCMSGEIFPSKDICINPNLRHNV
tara:strand:- start:1778 stop:2341 length:564 start_codon:yes stop_codon:yes gene_type:complete